MRRWLSFTCEGGMLAGALDEADGDAGLLIVSGGNETLSGSHGNMSAIAARLAAAGFPVFRYDRRGVGDSEGDNAGFEGAGADLVAAIAAFRAAAPQLGRVVGFGNCDGASLLALHHGDGLDALVLANPWVIEALGEMPPAAAIKARYREKLLDPAEWARLLRGGVDIGKVFKGLRAISSKPEQSGLAARIVAAIEGSAVPVRIVLAKRDATALAFADAWKSASTPEVIVREIDTNSHSFAHAADADALHRELLSALSG